MGDAIVFLTSRLSCVEHFDVVDFLSFHFNHSVHSVLVGVVVDVLHLVNLRKMMVYK